MKKRLLLIAAALCLGVLLCACQADSKKQSQADPSAASVGYKQVSTAEAVQLMQGEKDYIILDVRTKEEYNAGHIPRAICVPNESIGTADIPELPDKDQLILVYCRSGRRSKEAAQKLVGLGYTNITEFGGIIDWTGETVTEN